MDFSVIMQYISYLLVAIGVMAFVVSTVTQVCLLYTSDAADE